MNAIQKAYEALVPAHEHVVLTEWQKGVLVIERFNVQKAREEVLLEALTELLLHTPPDSPDEFDIYQPRISGLIDELVGTRVHMDEAVLQDIQGLLETGATMPEIRQRVLAQHTVAA